MSEQMPGGGDAKRAWIERVLGVSFSDEAVSMSVAPEPDGPDADAPDTDGLEVLSASDREELAARIKDIMTQGGLLPEPYRAEILGRARTVSASLEGGAVAGLAQEVDALENAYATAAGSARVGEAVAGVKGRVEYRKLQLAWRDAQSAAVSGLDRFVAAVLADPEVQAEEELYDEVVDAAAGASQLVPRFGGELADVLDRLDVVTSAEERDTLTREASGIIDDYAASLEEAEGLRDLQDLADDEYGGIPFFAGLQDALKSLRSAIA